MAHLLDDILADLPEALADRARQGLSLLRRQAIGCERMRTHAEAIIKADATPVTVADLLHQTQLGQMLEGDYPEDGLIGEEPRELQESVIEVATHAAHCVYGLPIEPRVAERPERGPITWICDPIDGTKGYLAGRYYALALGFFVEQEPFFAAVAVPHIEPAAPLRIDGSLAFAIAGRGAFLGRIEDDFRPPEYERLDQRAATPRPRPRIAVSLAHGRLREALAGDTSIELVALDSQAKYLGVAAGDLDAYLREGRGDGHPDTTWDHMPGGLIAREAGCAVVDFKGRPHEFPRERVIPLQGGLLCRRGPAGAPLEALLARLR